MKFSKTHFAAALLLAAICSGRIIEEEAKEEKRAVVTTALAVTAAVTVVLNGLAGFFSNLNGPKNVKDTIISNRAVRIVVDDDTGCASVTDRDTGYKSTKCADTSSAATAMATEELITLLIKIGQLSEDDLHHRPGAVTRPPTLCKDQVGAVKCQRHIKLGHCDIGSPFFHWMHANCFRSCAACNELDKVFPNKQNAVAGR